MLVKWWHIECVVKIQCECEREIIHTLYEDIVTCECGRHYEYVCNVNFVSPLEKMERKANAASQDNRAS
jgi:hypothetical protein